MLDNLSKSFQDVLSKFRRTGKLTEVDIKEGTREVRRALLEADVHFKVAKDFAKNIGDQLLEQTKLDGVSGGQQVVAAFHKQLTDLMSHELPELPKNPGHPMVLLLAGLQGAGKTTTAAKLALHMRKTQNRKVLMAACDLQRPGAVEQLQTLGKQLEIDVYAEDPQNSTPEKVATNALKHAKKGGYDALIVDSAGRLHVDEDLMGEIKRVSDAVEPDGTYLVLDSMTGQDAVESAQTFAATLDLYGLILTKIDGDTRGGAALSVTQITGKPICFLGVGEKPSEFEKFDAERIAGRILDMGDIVGLVETAQGAFDEKEAEVDYTRMMQGKFTMQDLLDQFKMMKKMGSMKKLLGMMPGMGKMSGLLDQVDDSQFTRMEAIILSMTPSERLHPETIDGKRRRRIASGSGVQVSDVNRLYKSYQQMKKQMQMMKKMMGGGKSKQRLLNQLSSSGKLPNMPGYNK